METRISGYKLKSSSSSLPNTARACQGLQFDSVELNRQFNQRHGLEFESRARLNKAARFAQVSHSAAEQGSGAEDKHLGHGIARIPGMATSILFFWGHADARRQSAR